VVVGVAGGVGFDFVVFVCFGTHGSILSGLGGRVPEASARGKASRRVGGVAIPLIAKCTMNGAPGDGSWLKVVFPNRRGVRDGWGIPVLV
jgi:hypothetical protein